MTVVSEYHIASGAHRLRRDGASPAAIALNPLAAGQDRIPTDMDAATQWVDHDAVLALRAQAVVGVVTENLARPPEPTDWSTCLRERSESPAELVGATEGALDLDLLAGVSAELLNVPAWSTLEIEGPTYQAESLSEGDDLVEIQLIEPGDYRVTLRSARHLPREWMIHAH